MVIKETKRLAGPADEYAGKALRRLRICKGMSQEELAKAVGVTFQQIQKYERAENRISTGRLHRFCEILGVSPMEFFSEDLSAGSPESGGKEERTLMRLFSNIHDTAKRSVVITVARELSHHDLPTAEEAECNL